MRHQCLLVACLIASVLASPLPPRASPVIGVVVPSDLVDTPKFGMGDSLERAAPSPAATSTSITAVLITSTVATSTSTSSSTISTVAATNNVALIPGNRFQGYGNVVSTSSSAAAPAVGMGEAVSRSRPPKAVQKRDDDEDDAEVVELKCVEYEDGTRECTESSDKDLERNELKRELKE